jgi:hypothetical protein
MKISKKNSQLFCLKTKKFIEKNTCDPIFFVAIMHKMN